MDIKFKRKKNERFLKIKIWNLPLRCIAIWFHHPQHLAITEMLSWVLEWGNDMKEQDPRRLWVAHWQQKKQTAAKEELKYWIHTSEISNTHFQQLIVWMFRGRKQLSVENTECCPQGELDIANVSSAPLLAHASIKRPNIRSHCTYSMDIDSKCPSTISLKQVCSRPEDTVQGPTLLVTISQTCARPRVPESMP